MKEKLKQLFGLFGAFAVVGVTTFGGGYAMLPALQREVVEKRRWATEEEVMDWYAIGQCTPGVIAVNTATFVGQKQAGIWGGIFATLGVVFPSLVIIMIIAVMLAVILMMVFIDPISNFINGHPEMKMLALTFIVAIGALLVIDSAGFHTGVELLHMPLEKLMVYFAMVFSIVLELIQMRYNANFMAWRKDRWKEDTQAQIENVRAEMIEQLEEAEKAIADDREAGVSVREERIKPVIIGNNVYIMMPMIGEDADSFKELMAGSEQAGKVFSEPLELAASEVTVEDVWEDDSEMRGDTR